MPPVLRVLPCDASEPVSLRPWTSQEPPAEDPDRDYGNVPMSTAEVDLYNAYSFPEEMFQAIKVADYMADEKKMSLLTIAVMSRCGSSPCTGTMHSSTSCRDGRIIQ